MSSRQKIVVACSVAAGLLALAGAVPSRAAAPAGPRAAGSLVQVAKSHSPGGGGGGGGANPKPSQPSPQCSSQTNSSTTNGSTANCSSNWFGYNQGLLEKTPSPSSGGVPGFHSISADWTVPTASQHTKGEDEFSSTWIGIGGGCVDARCAVTDNTLIQAGTEQDYLTSQPGPLGQQGGPDYYAWWEVIPAPSVPIQQPVPGGPSVGPITNMTVHPGDKMHVSIAEVAPGSEVWTITVADQTENETFSVTLPYSSSYATAEWIEETPLVLGTSSGFAALPDLSAMPFDNGTVNGNNANLTPSEALYLANSSNAIYSAPSAPDSDADGFNACAWKTSCPTFNS